MQLLPLKNLLFKSEMTGSGGIPINHKNMRTTVVKRRQGGWKVVMLVLVIVVCLFGLWTMQNESSSSLDVTSNTRRTQRVDVTFSGPPKIAFLFLTRRDLPLDFLWDYFFQGVDTTRYSIYIHSQPGFVFDESTSQSPLFYGRQLRNSIQVAWGQSSMIEAERLLLDSALKDPANQRFVLLSDSCVPLYNFSFIYDYVIGSPKSFVDSFLDKKEGRYNIKMSPAIPIDNWRKGSQWFTMIRRHAEVMVDDDLVFPVFKKYCKRRPPIDNTNGKLNLKLQKQHNCIPDEHYLQTLLTMEELQMELERRTLTYTEWNESASKMEGKGWHPVTFTSSTATPQLIKKVKGINHIYYETEARTEWCRTNSTAAPCFLFARKFSQAAGMRILSEGLGGFRV